MKKIVSAMSLTTLMSAPLFMGSQVAQARSSRSNIIIGAAVVGGAYYVVKGHHHHSKRSAALPAANSRFFARNSALGQAPEMKAATAS